MLRSCDLTSRRFKKRFHRNYHYYDSDFWNQRQREVLQGIDNMKICDPESVHVPSSVFFQNSKKMRRSRCYIYYTRGHAYWNYPNKNRRGEFKKGKQSIDETREAVENSQTDKTCLWDVIGSDGKGWNEIWYVSDEHLRHMTPNLEVFDKFKRDSACSSTTSQGGLDVQSFGEVMVRTESHEFVIPGAFYVPNIGLNILSQSQLIQQGFEVIFKNSKCIIRN